MPTLPASLPVLTVMAIVPLAGSAELREIAGMQVLPVAHVGEAMGAALPRG